MSHTPSLSFFVFRVWIRTVVLFWLIDLVFTMPANAAEIPFAILWLVAIAVLGSPTIVALYILLQLIRLIGFGNKTKLVLYGITVLLLCFANSLLFLLIGNLSEAIAQTSRLMLATILSHLFYLKPLCHLLGITAPAYHFSFTKTHTMETEQLPEQTLSLAKNPSSNRILVKGVTTAVLILLMLIPMTFVNNIVEERQGTKLRIEKEMETSWAAPQHVTTPYFVIPYKTPGNSQPQPLFIYADDLEVNTPSVTTQKRGRSVMTVVCYQAKVHMKGSFKAILPANIDASLLDLANARLCIGVTDTKGISEKPVIQLNGKTYSLNKGLPSYQMDSAGLSAVIPLDQAFFGNTYAFESSLQLNGTRQLGFTPAASNSNISVRGAWKSPAYTGIQQPATYEKNNTGFAAKWHFNEANLPFSTPALNPGTEAKDYAFYVSLSQPADNYVKTMRSVKYAILIIGLTFAIFFVTELLQKKPMHPVQYVLTGLALVIFYTLLLSISEFLDFDVAYLIAAVATVLLVTTYVQSHFRNFRVAGTFGVFLGALYTFLFVLIRLEEAALLSGSIGLFLILAIAMYATRKIDWYGSTRPALS
jgi:inner membrane protein